MIKKHSKEALAKVVSVSRYIPVCDELLLRENGIYLSPATLRKQHCKGINPKLFLKIGHNVYIDLEVWVETVAEAKRKRDERVYNLSEVMNRKLKAEVGK